MIDTITISNFQSHKKSEIKLGKNLNIIHGLSDSGKSGFVRALLAVLNRNPFYLNYTAKSGSVKITFSDGNVIERQYKKKKQQKCPECKVKISDNEQICHSCGTYLTVKPSSDKYIINGEEKEKFGSKLPEFIKEVSRIYPIKFVDVETYINIFTQHEDFFFIGNSYNGKYRNRLISSLIVDSEKIDELIKQLSSEKYQNNTKIKLLEKEHEKLSNKTEGVEVLLLIVKADLIKHEEIEKEYNDINNKIDNLQQIQSDLKTLPDATKLLKYINKYQAYSAKIDKMIAKLEKCTKSGKKLAVLKERLANIGKCEIEIPEKINFDDKIEKLSNIANKIEKLEKLKKLIKCVNMDIIELQKSKKDATMKYDKVMSEFDSYLKSDNTICPITKSRFLPDCLEKILKGVK